MDNLSQSSFKSAHSTFSKPANKVLIDGEMLDGEYINKEIITQSVITIQIPETIKNKVQGDKTVIVKGMIIHDDTITLLNKPKTTFQLVAKKQRNTFNSAGVQSQIIGYGTYNQNLDKFTLESQFFEMDSIIPIQIEIMIDRRDGMGYVKYQLPQNSIAFLYYEIQTIYCFM